MNDDSEEDSDSDIEVISSMLGEKLRLKSGKMYETAEFINSLKNKQFDELKSYYKKLPEELQELIGKELAEISNFKKHMKNIEI